MKSLEFDPRLSCPKEDRKYFYAMRKISLAFILSTVSAVSLSAAEITVIADRSGDNLEVYFRFDAKKMSSLFGVVPSGVLDENGFVDFHALQADTITPAAQLVSDMSAYSGKRQIEFEAISFMTHPTQSVLPFGTPWDALTTTTFCTTDPEGEKQTLDVMQTYVGYFADQLTKGRPVVIDFPYASVEGMTVDVLEFENKVKTGQYETAMSKDGELVLFASNRQSSGLFSWLTRN